MIRQTVPTSLRQLGDDEVECILSTGALARDGHILDPAGCDLTGYRRSPIVLWQHIPSEPVGRASAITVHHDRITARVTFAPLGVSAQADKVRGLVKSGVITSMSVGFDPKDGVPLDPKRPRDGQRITKWELLECSFVSLPADTGAVVTARAYRSAQMSKQIIRASEAISEAQRHHHDLRVAMENGEYGRAMRAHRHIGRCLDTAERCLRGLSDGTELAAQTSSGMSSGKSDGRSFAARQAAVARLAPSVAQRAFEAAQLAPKPPTWSGGSVVHWTAGMREYLQADALARARVNIAGRYSKAYRQGEVARLARSE